MAAVLGGIALLLTACSGGGDGSGPRTPQDRVTDPALVPTSTPIGGELIFRYRDGGVSAPGNLNGTPIASDTPSSGSTYTVQSGDNCSAIAARFGTTFDELRRLNPTINADCSNLQAGQTIEIPGGSGGSNGGTNPTPTPEPSGETYTIQSGDTCTHIAQSYGVDLQELIDLNGLDCSNLQVGTVVQIP